MLKSIGSRRRKIPLADISVAIGPCISQTAYEVDQQVISAVNGCLSNTMKRPYINQGNGSFLLDLRELNKQLLIEEGLKEEQILSVFHLYSH